MRVLFVVVGLLLGLPGHAFAAPCLPARLVDLRESDTWSAAGLSHAEEETLIQFLSETAFDEPETWQGEIRLKAVRLGRMDVLVARGTALLCGATGNCQTWMLSQEGGEWRSILPPPSIIASTVRTTGECSSNMPNLEVLANYSGGIESRSVFQFADHAYQEVDSSIRHLD